MNFEVDGTSLPISSFALPEMSLSSARSRMDKWSFSLSFSDIEFKNLLEHEYRQLVIDLKEDDEQIGEVQDELCKAGYPELDEVLQDNELLFSAIDYLFEDLIGKFSSVGNSAVYWHDEISSCEYWKGDIHIQGVCYSKAKT